MLKQRSAVAEDRAILDDFIYQDEDHQGRVIADFWLPAKEKDSTARFVAEDSVGPVMFVRGENVLRLHIQFSASKLRNARALAEFIPMIEKDAKKHGFTQIIFDSVAEPLIKFSEKFGYRRSQCEVIKDL